MTCEKCGKEFRVQVTTMNVPGGKEKEEIYCPEGTKITLKIGGDTYNVTSKKYTEVRIRRRPGG